MTVETPPAGMPGMAGRGHSLDIRTELDPAWVRALRGLAAELRSCGLEACTDGTVGAVDAADPEAPSRAVQRIVLRPHRGRLWWWLRRPTGPAGAPQHTPLAPASDTSGAARRIRDVLRSGRCTR